ncbi:SepM family pheromone-processing serine protease [Evansella cellulosilytica]|uniref:endopeptidase La n=1 Tax=Evansella cellulosilytica (strain ATCC 21833 / DSM 2522 / FERM P-1141 / JCM 9156 / N-4) TaxID=649639 RepID=E6TTU9_EVAC2|nr:SepM family pheromone-processing serine protease [Evansella cellulosilytica]ADU30868.1 PDZ/DHR/GLGF domain protein [Evansella cellulosilytica DSM 2522]
MTKEMHPNNRGLIKWIIIIVLLLFINFYQLPYYFTIPGDAKILTEFIEVEDGNKHEGTFMLTTVRIGRANVVNYVWALFSDERELVPEDQIRREGETDEEYQHRQLMMMTSSQDLAVFVAYNHAGETAYFENKGVYVTAVVPDMDAEGKLEMGDRIVAVDGEEVFEASKLLDLLADYSVGENVTLTIEREEEISDVSIELMYFPSDLDPSGERGGIGIAQPVTDRTLIHEPHISIDTNQIGGPSAGLMFTLEIYNQLTEEDITEGYHIAGTGTIDEDGIVGRIGGVKQKVIASHHAGADFFFAPNERGSDISNYAVALETAESINTDMEIVPIDSFEEALEFLNNLK